MNQIQKKEFLPANQKSADYIYKKIMLRMHVFFLISFLKLTSYFKGEN